MLPPGLTALGLLSKAPSKAALLQAFNDVFSTRDDDPETRWRMPLLLDDFGLDESEAKSAYDAMHAVIALVLYGGDVSDLDNELSTRDVELDVRLVKLVKQILVNQLPGWKAASTLQRPFLPLLVDLDWHIDMQVASDTSPPSAPPQQPILPTLLLGLELQEQPSQRRVPPQRRKVDVQLSREALDTILEGLRKIRDQLNRVAGEPPGKQ